MNFMYHHLLHTKDLIVELYSVLSTYQQHRLISSLLDVSSYANSMYPLISSLKQNIQSNSMNKTTTATSTTTANNIQSLKKRKKSTMDELKEQTIRTLPHILQTLLLHKSQNKDQRCFQVPNIFDTALVAIWMIYSIFRNDIPDLDLTEKYKKIFIDRLFEPVSFHSSTKDCFKEDLDIYRFTVTEMTCQVLVLLINAANSQDLSHVELMVLLRKLMYPLKYEVSTNNDGRSSCHENPNVVSGLILAKHMIHSPHMVPAHCEEIMKLVLHLI